MNMDFESCFNEETKELIIPEGTVSIIGEEHKFMTCEEFEKFPSFLIPCKGDLIKKVEKITMPDSVVILGSKSIRSCTNLKEIRLSENLKTIQLSAFMHCMDLRTIKFPVSLQEIESWAFSGLDDIYYDGSIFQFDKIKTDGAFGNIHRLHCSDCLVDFSKEDFYIEELSYPGSIEDCSKDMKISDSWIYKRTKIIHCNDGIINREEILKNNPDKKAKMKLFAEWRKTHSN